MDACVDKGKKGEQIRRDADQTSCCMMIIKLFVCASGMRRYGGRI